MTTIETTLNNRAIGALSRPQKTRDKNDQKHGIFRPKTRSGKQMKTRYLP
jgi:hypothetical protein